MPHRDGSSKVGAWTNRGVLVDRDGAGSGRARAVWSRGGSSLARRVVERWRRISPGTKDSTFAILWSFATQVELLVADLVEGSLAAQSLAFAVMTLSLVWRRTRPLLAAVLLGAAIAAQTLIGSAEIVGGFVAMLVGTYSIASYATNVRSLAVGSAFVFAGLFTYPVVNEMNFADEVGNFVIFASLWVLGRLVRTWRRGAAEAEEHAAAVERAREEHVRLALADERGRIARELHDVVAHGVSGMVLQAGAARQLLHRDPAAAEEPLLAVEGLGRQALEEMRRLLGLLRRDDEDLALAPPLQLGAIGRLVDDVRRSGVAVTSRIEGDERPLPTGLEVSAYRIVQEALTNVVKHADASQVEVVLRYDDEGLELIIVDDGCGSAGDDAHAVGTGHGLLGMRERAELFGGTLIAGPRQPTGWQVHARLATGGQA